MRGRAQEPDTRWVHLDAWARDHKVLHPRQGCHLINPASMRRPFGVLPWEMCRRFASARTERGGSEPTGRQTSAEGVFGTCTRTEAGTVSRRVPGWWTGAGTVEQRSCPSRRGGVTRRLERGNGHCGGRREADGTGGGREGIPRRTEAREAKPRPSGIDGMTVEEWPG